MLVVAKPAQLVFQVVDLLILSPRLVWVLLERLVGRLAPYPDALATLCQSS